MAISNNSTGLRPGVCTSSTRPTAPYEGQMIYETDTDLTYVWNGSMWVVISRLGQWANWTPTVTQGNTLTFSIQRCTYTQIGRLVIVQGQLSFTNAGTASTTIFMDVPINTRIDNTRAFSLGTYAYWDAGSAVYTGVVATGVTNQKVYFLPEVIGASTTGLGVTPAVTVASGDYLSFSFMYEAA